MNNFEEYKLFGPDIEYYQNWKKLVDTLNNLQVSSMLNIGLGDICGVAARRWNYFLSKECPTIKRIINLEIEPYFCENVKHSGDILINNVICGDVRYFDTQNLNVDFIFYSHGPEHIFREEWENTFKKLEQLSNKVVILQMPWGSGYNFDPGHLSPSIRVGEIEQFGYTCYYQGIEDTLNASLAGIKIK